MPKWLRTWAARLWPNGDEVINKITHLNTMREFSCDPLTLLGRENCTVGALKALAKHVSIEPALGLGGAARHGTARHGTARHGTAPKRDPSKPVTSGDINRMFASADAGIAL